MKCVQYSHGQREDFGRSNNRFSSLRHGIVKERLLAVSRTGDCGEERFGPSAVVCSWRIPVDV